MYIKSKTEMTFKDNPIVRIGIESQNSIRIFPLCIIEWINIYLFYCFYYYYYYFLKKTGDSQVILLLTINLDNADHHLRFTCSEAEQKQSLFCLIMLFYRVQIVNTKLILSPCTNIGYILVPTLFKVMFNCLIVYTQHLIYR